SSRRRHTSFSRDWSSDVCSSDLVIKHADAYTRLGGVMGNHDTGGVLAERKLELGTAGVRLSRYVGRVSALEYDAFAALLLHSHRSEERRVGKRESLVFQLCASVQ